MKTILSGAAGLAIMASMAHAGGLDRSGQSVGAVFNDPGTLSFSFGNVSPGITGVDNITASNYDVGDSYSAFGLTYTHGISDQLSLTVIYDQPFGAAVEYDGVPAASMLAGTSAQLDTNAVTALMRYKVNDNISVFGGLRAQKITADIALNGLAYTGSIGTDYRVALDSSVGYGYTVGAAYEIPAIALRAALTYHSEIEHDADSTEYFGGAAAGMSTTTYVSPQSVNLEFQTGIAADTLLTAGVRWAEWSAVDVAPQLLGSDLVDLGNTFTYKVGVARRFSETWAASVTMTYEAEGDELVSPLGPTNGVFGVTVGAQYTMDDITIAGGVNYSWLGDAQAQAGGVGLATFEDNSAVGIGFSVSIAM